MWFLIKCLIVFALFYVVAMAEERDKISASGGKLVASMGVRSDAPSDRQVAVRRLQRAATREIVSAARDRCLAQPAECAKALRLAGEAASPHR